MSPWKNKVEKGFSHAAADYKNYSAAQRRAANTLMEITQSALPCAPRHILEIGCGDGFVTRILRQTYPSALITATDISSHMINMAQENFGDDAISWKVMDGEIPDIDTRYDLIISHMAVQWFEDLPHAYGKWKNLLSERGIIVTSRIGPMQFIEWRKSCEALALPCGLLDYTKTDYEQTEQCFALSYGDSFSFLKELKASGVHTAKAAYSPLPVRDLKRAVQWCDDQYAGQFTWHIIYDLINSQ